VKMSDYIVLLLAGLVGCAWLIRRHGRRMPCDTKLVVRHIEGLRPEEGRT